MLTIKPLPGDIISELDRRQVLLTQLTCRGKIFKVQSWEKFQDGSTLIFKIPKVPYITV